MVTSSIGQTLRTWFIGIRRSTLFPASLNGRFHGIVVDRRRSTATLFNDRYGMQRLYYRVASDGFYFAGEAKAILAVCPEARTIDHQALGDFVTCGAVLENRSLFDGIQVLPPGSAWKFRYGALEERRSYFSPEEWERQDPFDAEAFYQELRGVFDRILPRYFSGDERIAMSLTGGLDTRMIMAWRKPEIGALACYTFGGMRRDCQDVTVARQVASVCGQVHEVIHLGADFLPKFRHYAERAVYLTDGCVDTSRSADLYLNEKARKIAPVRVTGNYGGEVLRKVRAFKAEEPSAGVFSQELSPWIEQARVAYKKLLNRHPVSFAAFKQAPWHHYGILALEETQVSMCSPFLDNDLVRTIYRAPASSLASNEVSLRLIADGHPGLSQLPTDRAVAGNRGRIRETTSHAIQEFLFKAEYAYDMGMPQWLARVDHFLSPFHLEKLFLGRHKIAHFRSWYRDSFSEYVRETLLDASHLSRAHIKRHRVEEIVRGHLSGTQNYTTEIHKLLTLDIVQRLLVNIGEQKEHRSLAYSNAPAE